MRKVSDRLKLVKNIQYYKKEGDKIFKKRFGLEKILQANSRMGRRKIDKDILYALADGKNGEGFFMPDRVVNKNNIITIIKDKRFPPELVKQLAAVQSQITGARLRDEEKRFNKTFNDSKKRFIMLYRFFEVYTIGYILFLDVIYVNIFYDKYSITY